MNKRNQKKAKDIKNKYKRCQFCGFDDMAALEAAHVMDFSDGGRDDEHNLLCLCANCHTIFDHGLIGFEDDLTIVCYDNKKRPYLKDKVDIKLGILDQLCVDWKQQWRNIFSS